MTETDGREETIENWLIINWKKGNTRTRKSEPNARDLGTHEVATRLQITVVVPEVEIPELAARVEVPGPQVATAVLEDADEDSLPDWTDVANEVLAEALEINPTDAELRGHVDTMVVDTLGDAPGRPDVDDVRRYLKRAVEDVLDDSGADS